MADGPSLVIVSVKSKSVPAMTGLPCSSSFVIRRSATLATVSDVEALLAAPPPAGSSVVVVAVAVFTIVCPERSAPTRAVTTTSALDPAPRDPSEQVTVEVPVQLPRVGAADTRVSPAGRASLTVTSAAADGPALETRTVYRTVSPATSGASSVVLVTPMSASGVTVVVWTATSLAGSGSVASVRTRAEFVVGPVAVVRAVASKRTVAVVPAATTGMVQDRLASEQSVVSGEEIEVGTVWVSGVSVTRTLWASDGPGFVTVMVYPMVSPGRTGSTSSVFVSERSATGRAVTRAVAESSVVSSSYSFASTVTVSATSVPSGSDGGVLPTTVIVREAPLARSGTVHEIVDAPTVAPGHVAPVTDTKELLDSESVRVMPVAAFGPSLRTTMFHVTFRPGATGSGDPVLVTLSRASGGTGVTTSLVVKVKRSWSVCAV